MINEFSFLHFLSMSNVILHLLGWYRSSGSIKDLVGSSTLASSPAKAIKSLPHHKGQRNYNQTQKAKEKTKKQIVKKGKKKKKNKKKTQSSKEEDKFGKPKVRKGKKKTKRQTKTPDVTHKVDQQKVNKSKKMTKKQTKYPTGKDKADKPKVEKGKMKKKKQNQTKSSARYISST
jgi:hypothetical protein